MIDRPAARAIIARGDKLLVMKRNKFGDVYYVLVGGGIDPGETPEQAVIREVKEEANLSVLKIRKVFIESPLKTYGKQHIYLCEDPGGEVSLRPDSIEAELNKLGNNTYQTMWLDIKDLADVRFLSPKLKTKLLEAFQDGFPEKVIHID